MKSRELEHQKFRGGNKDFLQISPAPEVQFAWFDRTNHELMILYSTPTLNADILKTPGGCLITVIAAEVTEHSEWSLSNKDSIASVVVGLSPPLDFIHESTNQTNSFSKNFTSHHT
jgi:hypothetical protein